MSVKVMGAVWDAKLPRAQKYVLLAYADHAAHDGSSIYPSVALMMQKTGYSERSIQALTRDLEERGILVDDGSGPNGVNRWRIDLDVLVSLAAGGAESAGGAKNDAGGVQKTTQGGAKSAPNPSSEPSVKSSSLPSEGVATPPPAPTCFHDWLAILKEPRTADGGKSNRNAVLVWMHHALYPEHDPPEFGYVGKVARQVGGAARLAQLLWEHATRPPVGDVLAYIVAAEQGRKKQERGARAARGGNGPDGTLEEFMRLGLEGR